MNLRNKAIAKAAKATDKQATKEKLLKGLRGTEADPAVTPTPQCKKILAYLLRGVVS